MAPGPGNRGRCERRRLPQSALAEALESRRLVELLDHLEDEVDLIDGFAYPLPIRVICELFDVPRAMLPMVTVRPATSMLMARPLTT